MTQDNRIKGGQIDRSRTLRFTFDGHPYTGHPGDTLASALLANGVRLMGRAAPFRQAAKNPTPSSNSAPARGRNPTPAPPWPNCSTGWKPTARTASPRSNST
jgi:hypothetical protein